MLNIYYFEIKQVQFARISNLFGKNIDFFGKCAIIDLKRGGIV